MANIKDVIKLLLTKTIAKKIIAIVLLISAIYFFRDFAFIFFLTFIFAFLFIAIGKFIREKIDIFLDKIGYKKDKKAFFRKNFGIDFFLVLEYVLFIAIIYIILYNLLPQLINELKELPKTIPFVEGQVQQISQKLEEIKNLNTEIEGSFNEVISSGDYEVILNVLNKIKVAGIFFLQFLLSLVLSFIFLMDRRKLTKYLKGIKRSNFYFLYDEYKTLIIKISKSFGLILKAQSMIAFVNTLFTLVGLLVIGKIYSDTGNFPYILTLGLIVFIFGFIPVLGVFLSSVPIIIIAYTFGGLHAAIAVIVLVTIVHIIEAYYLNPKIVSSYFELPVSLTFVILIVSEHFLGFAGLLIGVSSFYFIIGILSDADKIITKKKRKLRQKKLQEKTLKDTSKINSRKTSLKI